jgi:voltage-dependent calcium channel L type alpha-1D
VFLLLDVIFSIVFAVEMVLKVVAFGLYESDDTYLRDSWNVMDGFIVVLGLLSLFLGNANLGWIRSLRTIKVMRPLRVINRVPELKVVVAALFKSVPELVNVALVSAVIWLIFGILGMQVRSPAPLHSAQ